jgi:hypothetical protein
MLTRAYVIKNHAMKTYGGMQILLHHSHRQNRTLKNTELSQLISFYQEKSEIVLVVQKNLVFFLSFFFLSLSLLVFIYLLTFIYLFIFTN